MDGDIDDSASSSSGEKSNLDDYLKENLPSGIDEVQSQDEEFDASYSSFNYFKTTPSSQSLKLNDLLEELDS